MTREWTAGAARDVNRLQPAYVADNPIMQAAFASFMNWAWDQDDMHAAYCADSGQARPTPPRNGLDAMIDEATGCTETYASGFVEWAIREHWGAEGDPRLGEDLD